MPFQQNNFVSLVSLLTTYQLHRDVQLWIVLQAMIVSGMITLLHVALKVGFTNEQTSGIRQFIDQPAYLHLDFT